MKDDDFSRVRRVLVYKRTHNGDPNELGQFGCNDCMRSVRDRDFDAVIGVGGITGARYKIQGKVNWIGVMPIEKNGARSSRNDRATRSGARILTFEHFLAFRECGYFPPGERDRLMFVGAPAGPEIRTIAPIISSRLFEGRARTLMLDRSCDDEFKEAMGILALSISAPSSSTAKVARRIGGIGNSRGRHRCC